MVCVCSLVLVLYWNLELQSLDLRVMERRSKNEKWNCMRERSGQINLIFIDAHQILCTYNKNDYIVNIFVKSNFDRKFDLFKGVMNKIHEVKLNKLKLTKQNSESTFTVF